MVTGQVSQVKGSEVHTSQVTTHSGKSVYDYETEKFLLEITYLNLGMVPPSHYPRSDVGSLERCLAGMDPDEAHRAKRKFRKFRRRSKKAHWKSPSFDTVQCAVKWHIVNRHMRSDLPDNDE